VTPGVFHSVRPVNIRRKVAVTHGATEQRNV
jgi:hypothetical protein